MILIIGIFLLTALLGLYLASFLFRNKNTPKGLVFIHGPLAVTGLILLIFYTALHIHMAFFSWFAIGFFVLAAAFGLTMIFRDITGKSVPKWLVFLHASFALLGVIFLIFTLV